MGKKHPSERVRPQLGDIVEIETDKGLAYAQYTFRHRDPPKFGTLIRVLPGFYDERPSDFAELARAEEQFWTFYWLGIACADGLVRIVAQEVIPEKASGIPLMRAPGVRLPNGNVSAWWLWDGEKEWQLDALTEEHNQLSQLAIVSHGVLVDLIERGGWPPGDHAIETITPS